jgi:hypothetical protein
MIDSPPSHLARGTVPRTTHWEYAFLLLGEISNPHATEATYFAIEALSRDALSRMSLLGVSSFKTLSSEKENIR